MATLLEHQLSAFLLEEFVYVQLIVLQALGHDVAVVLVAFGFVGDLFGNEVHVVYYFQYLLIYVIVLHPAAAEVHNDKLCAAVGNESLHIYIKLDLLHKRETILSRFVAQDQVVIFVPNLFNEKFGVVFFVFDYVDFVN